MSSLFATTIIKGNRLTDFAQSTATVGVVIPFGWGRFASNGNVIFAPLPPNEHVTRKRQGKGGTKTETYTYTLSYAVAFARGPIYGYLWIKRNGKVVYTTDPNAPIEDLAYSAKWLEKATLYYGTPDQLPDSTIESHAGTGMVSAFRFLAYIVVEEDDVTEGGGAVPTYEACVIATPPEAYLTSPPYPIEFVEAVITSQNYIGGQLPTLRDAIPVDEFSEISASFVGGRLRNIREQYDAEDESFEVSGSYSSGRLKTIRKEHTQDPESFEISASFAQGRLDTIRLEHQQPHEDLEVSASFVGGYLRAP